MADEMTASSPQAESQTRLAGALCQQVYQDTPASRVALTDRAMQRIAGEQRNVFRRRMLRAVGSVAAMILIAVSVGLLLQSPTELSASTVCEKVLQAYESSGNRSYRILISLAQDPPSKPATGRRKTQQLLASLTKEDSLKAWENAILTVGESQRYRLEMRHRGRALLRGYDGKAYWQWSPERGVQTSADPATFRIPMPEILAALLTGDLRTMLDQLQIQYRLTMQPEGVDVLVVGLRKDRAGKLPARITLTASREDWTLTRVEFSDIRLQGRAERYRITLVRQEDVALPASGFSPPEE
jgi:hypothetical protein